MEATSKAFWPCIFAFTELWLFFVHPFLDNTTLPRPSGNAQAKPVWSTPSPLTLPAARVAAPAVVATFFSAPSWLHLCSALSVFAAFVSPKSCGLFYLYAVLSLTHDLYLSIVRNWRYRWPWPFTASAKSIHEAATSLRPQRGSK